MRLTQLTIESVAANSRIEQDEEDDLNVYTNSPLMQQQQQDKGKGKATANPHQSSPVLSGNISGSTARAANSNAGSSGAHRQMVGGMSLESRYTANSSGTLDEPLSATLVWLSIPFLCANTGIDRWSLTVT